MGKCHSEKHCCCKPCPPCPPPVDCNAVIARFHEELGEAIALFEQADARIACAAKHVNEAIDDICESFKLDKEADRIAECAYDALFRSGCYCGSPQCDCFLRNAQRYWAAKDQEVHNALNALKAAKASLARAAQFEECADEQFEKYVDCIHAPKC
ncbi:MAG: hypothetical protein ACRC5C_03315 [Bacilli bacterium]